MAQFVVTKVKKSVHTRVKTVFFVGLIASGFGFLPAALKQQFPQATQPVSPAPIEQKTSESRPASPSLSCTETCALTFNYCKFTQKQAEATCNAAHAKCDAGCPPDPIVPNPNADGGSNPNPSPQAQPYRLDDSITPSSFVNTTPPIDCSGLTNLSPINKEASYLILTRPMFVTALSPFVSAKQLAGETVETVLVDRIVCSEPGRDVQEKIRHYLSRMKAETKNYKELIKVLIVGAPLREPMHTNAALGRIGLSLTQPWEIPMRYVAGLVGGPAIPTDQYYASMNDAWNTNVDYSDPASYAALHDWQKTFDFNADFFVGRVPARNVEDLTSWIDKTLHWRAPTAFVESKFVTALCSSRLADSRDEWESSSTHRVISHACQTDSGGDIATFANRESSDLVSSYSHGYVRGIVNFSGSFGYTLEADSPGFTKPPILFVHGCEVGGVDYAEESLAESYIARPDGVVAFIGSTRSHFDTAFQFQDAVFHKGYLSLGEAFYWAKMSMVADAYQAEGGIDNLFMFSLYGDPGLKIVEPEVRIRSSAPVVHVPGMVEHEPFSIPVRLSSFLSRDLTGGLHYETYDLLPEGTTVPAHGSVNTVLRGFSTPNGVHPRVDLALPTVRTLQFSSRASTACDTSRMTCITSNIILAPPAYLGCARLRRTYSGVSFTGKTANVKLLNSSLAPAPLTFVLTLYPGTYLPLVRGMDILTRRTGTEVARMRVERPEQNGIYQFSFNRTPTSTLADPSYMGTDYYWNPLFKAEAFDDAGHKQGWCWYSNGLEPDIEGAFAEL